MAGPIAVPEIQGKIDSLPWRTRPQRAHGQFRAVLEIMYPNGTYNESAEALNEWYRLFLIPGAVHCSPNSQQANAGFPQTNFAVMINWVENGITPTTLNGTIRLGDYVGDNQQICAWPLRPYWTGNETNPSCVYDQASLDTWKNDFDGVDIPVY